LMTSFFVFFDIEFRSLTFLLFGFELDLDLSFLPGMLMNDE
jgi:hypothetical protein